LSERDPLTAKIIDAALEVHRQLGPGLLETSYQAALAYELALRCIPFRRECPIPLIYKETKLEEIGYRCNFIVDNKGSLRSRLRRESARETKHN
jgi:GxxExxY protein